MYTQTKKDIGRDQVFHSASYAACWRFLSQRGLRLTTKGVWYAHDGRVGTVYKAAENDYRAYITRPIR